MPTSRFQEAHFASKRLYLRSEDEEMEILGWPTLSAQRRDTGTSTWVPFAPGFKLLRPYRPPAKTTGEPRPQLELGLLPPTPVGPLAADVRNAFDGFRFTFPKALARVLEKIQTDQWPLFQFLKENPAGQDLLQSNPALAFALGQATAFVDAPTGPRNRPMRPAMLLGLARAHAAKKQKDLVVWLGFPAQAAAVKRLRDCAPESISLRFLLQLRDALAIPAQQKAMAHMEVLNIGVLQLLQSEPAALHLSKTMLDEVAASRAERYRARTAHWLDDLLRMHEELEGEPLQRRFRSIAEVREAHDEIRERYLQEVEPSLRHLRFPKPPLPGNRVIHPIISPLGLAQEGESQDNCVASYAKRVAKGDCFIYRVDVPERATLSIRSCHRSGRWEISELEKSSNRDASEETWECVELWLSRAQRRT